MRPPHPPRKLLGLNVSDLLAERRRAGISFAVGLIVLLLIQIPAVEQSFLGGPDRQMMEWAFRLRADNIGGLADPVVLMDFDNATISKLGGAKPFAPPLETMPRSAIADLLNFMRAAPAGQAPRAVLVDVDLSAPPSDGQAGVDKLKAALAAWASDKGAPPLIMVRDVYPAAAVGLDGPGKVLPDTPYDPIVNPAQNIFWSEAQVLADQNGVVREFLPYECVITSAASGGRVKPLYSAALLAYGYSETDPAVLDRAEVKHWMVEAANRCQGGPTLSLTRGEKIDFHLSMEVGFATRVWPDLNPRWPGFAVCGHADRTVLRRISAIDVLDALGGGGEIDHALFCRHLVIIGGTNDSDRDFVQTPLNEMNGSIVLANAVRGLELTHGGLKPILLIWQILLLALVSLAISTSAAATSRARQRYVRLRSGPHKDRLSQRLAILPLNPIILNGLIALTAHCLGIALLFVSLNLGLWGFLSAPAFAAAITETVQEFSDG